MQRMLEMLTISSRRFEDRYSRSTLALPRFQVLLPDARADARSE